MWLLPVVEYEVWSLLHAWSSSGHRWLSLGCRQKRQMWPRSVYRAMTEVISHECLQGTAEAAAAANWMRVDVATLAIFASWHRRNRSRAHGTPLINRFSDASWNDYALIRRQQSYVHTYMQPLIITSCLLGSHSRIKLPELWLSMFNNVAMLYATIR